MRRSRLVIAKSLVMAKILVARFLCSRAPAALVSRLTGHKIRSFGLLFNTSDPAISSSVEASLFWQLYESAEIRFVRRYFQGCSTVVDLGSSLGFTAAHALSAMAPDGRLIGVEPNPTIIHSLRRTLEDHAGGRQISIVDAAIAYGREWVRLQPGNETWASKLGEDGIRVRATTLGAILKEHAVTDYCLLADIEGAEWEIVERDPDALATCQQAVVELHNHEQASTESLIGAFGRLGLHVVDRHAGVVVLAR
jgi:FkbM family methyltransferase